MDKPIDWFGLARKTTNKLTWLLKKLTAMGRVYNKEVYFNGNFQLTPKMASAIERCPIKEFPL